MVPTMEGKCCLYLHELFQNLPLCTFCLLKDWQYFRQYLNANTKLLAEMEKGHILKFKRKIYSVGIKNMDY